MKIFTYRFKCQKMLIDLISFFMFKPKAFPGLFSVHSQEKEPRVFNFLNLYDASINGFS